VEEAPEAVPLSTGAISLRSVYASEDGMYLITLLYDKAHKPPDGDLPQAFFTLMLEQRTVPLPPSKQWPRL
jgi:hypothetical protein